MDKIKIIESYANRKAEAHKITTATNEASAARLVWFVAIAGFAFLNVPIFVKALLSEPISGIVLIVVTIPWAIAALFGVIAHWLIGDLIKLDDQYYTASMAPLHTFIVMDKGDVSEKQFLDLLDGKNENVTAQQEKLNRLFPWVARIERLTFFFLCVAFAWSVIYALILIR